MPPSVTILISTASPTLKGTFSTSGLLLALFSTSSFWRLKNTLLARLRGELNFGLGFSVVKW